MKVVGGTGATGGRTHGPVASKDRRDLEGAGMMVITSKVVNETQDPAGRISALGELARPLHWPLAQFCEAGDRFVKVSFSNGHLIFEMNSVTECASQRVRI